jgi:hypothetical protein
MNFTLPTWISHEPAWWIAVATAVVGLLVAFFPSALTTDEKAGIIAVVTLLANGIGTRALVTANTKLAPSGQNIVVPVPAPPTPPPPPVNPQVPPGV